VGAGGVFVERGNAGGVLLSPVLFVSSAKAPVAVLLGPTLNVRVPSPMAVFWMPVVLKKSALTPTAVL
jgi:hypothetical protein